MTNLIKQADVMIDNGEYYLDEGNVVVEEAIEKKLRSHAQNVRSNVSDANEILQRAAVNADRMIANAQSDAKTRVDTAREKGHAEGFNRGFKSGFQNGRDQIMNQLEKITTDISSYLDQIKEVLENKSDDKNHYAELAFQLAQKIVAIEIKRNDEAFTSLYMMAASHFGETESIELKAGPRGCEVAEKNRKRFEAAIRGLKNLKITQSSKDDGTCILATSSGEADASVKTQFEHARKIVGLVK